MRFLTIVRHARALPARARESDESRTLSERGRAQCAQLRQWAQDPRELGRFSPAVALVSAARRTQETFELAFAGTTLVNEFHVTGTIYNGVRDVSGGDLLRALREVNGDGRSLLLVAHNPSVEELLALLTNVHLPDGYPTGGAFVVALPGEEQIGASEGEVVASYVAR